MTIFSIDGLSGFEQAIKATYPESVVQRCIIHQIRSSTHYVSYKHFKELIKDLKSYIKHQTKNWVIKSYLNLRRNGVHSIMDGELACDFTIFLNTHQTYVK